MPDKILVVDDEQEIADLVTLYLQNDGYEVYTCYDAHSALAYVDKLQLQLAILDVMLPDMSGFALCQQIRQTHMFPIIMLTAKGEDLDKITGLTLGADDYMTKPFNPLELVARVKTQLQSRRAAGCAPVLRLCWADHLPRQPQMHPLRRRAGADAHRI